MAASLGRPVRLSSVELRLLPWPGFVLTDLTVEEDPAYGAEPVLHANTVTASFRLLSLWRGRLEISRISVDEASLNLVRTGSGRWNLDALFRTAAAHAGGQAGRQAGNVKGIPPLPYLLATNSRVNIKFGAEKLPFSLVNTDLSFWQQEPGDWRIRLRGQPARTDLSLDLADTGVVRLEASVRQAAELRLMPAHLDLEWREAQLGQLARLVIGSDPGWRGDLTGELHLDGTAEAAQVKTRLRATGVHRAEFAPPAPLDFDARCGFVYHYSKRAVENLECDSPLGNGRIHLMADMAENLAGALPGEGSLPRFSVELDRIPVAAGLDALRTVRSGLGPGLEAKGEISGKLVYEEIPTAVGAQKKTAAATLSEVKEKPGPQSIKVQLGKSFSKPPSKPHAPEQGPLSGSLIVEGLQLSGDGLSTPIRVPKLVLEPVAGSRDSGRSLSQALVATVAIPAGGANPLMVTSRLTLSGYQETVRGQASLARGRELAHLAGLADAAALDALVGDSVTVDLKAQGPWLPAQRIPFSNIVPTGAGSSGLPQARLREPVPPSDPDAVEFPATDSLSGTVTLRNADWKADYLANHVQIAQATLHLGNAGEGGETRWDPVVFSYGPVKGTASLSLPASCNAAPPCLPHFQVQFGALDAGVLQAAILGAHEPDTLLSELIARLRPSSASSPSATPAWPELEGTVKADSFVLGPVTLKEASAVLRILPAGAEIISLDAGLLGGRVHGSGTLHATGAGQVSSGQASSGQARPGQARPSQGKPNYTLDAHFEKLSPAGVGKLLGLRWSGGDFDGDGKIALSGFTDKDLISSAQGTLHFEWRHGAVDGPIGTLPALPGALPVTASVPPALTRFDLWTGDAEIADSRITLKQNQVRKGPRKQKVEAEITLGDPPKPAFAVSVVSGEMPAKKH
jgi:hypothetical protein